MLSKLLKHYKDSFSGLPRTAWILSFILFINRSGTMVIFFMTLYLTESMAFSITTAGRMVSIYGFGTLCGAWVGGWLSDKIGTRRVQFYSLLLSGVGFIVLGYLKSQTALSIMLFIVAALADAFRPANMTAISEASTPDVRTRSFALQRLAANLGIAIGPAVGGYLAIVNYTYIFWVDGLTCIAAAGLVILLVKPGVRAENKPGDEVVVKKHLWQDLVFVATLFHLLILGLILFQIFNTWPLYFRHAYGLAENQIGLLLTINAAIIVLIEMPIIHKLERKQPLRIIAYGSLLLAGGFALLPLGRSFPFAALTVVVLTLGEILVFPLIVSFVAGRAPEQNRGKYMGMFTFIFALAFVIGPALGTRVYETCSPEILWFGIGVLGLLIYFGFMGIHRMIQREEPTGPEASC